MGQFELLAMAGSALARLALDTGSRQGAKPDVENAAEAVTRLLAALEAKNLWAPSIRVLPHAVRLRLATDECAVARELLERAEPELRGLDAPLAPATLEWARGLLSAHERDWANAAAHLLAAAELHEQLECPYEAAQTHEQAAVALAEADDPRAEAEFVAALTLYRRLGADWDIGRCSKAARAHGVPVPQPHRGGRKGYGDALSPREEATAQLAAVGLTNKEIAAELFVAPTTVEKHLGRAMRKLSVRSRSALAARILATDQGDARPG